MKSLIVLVLTLIVPLAQADLVKFGSYGCLGSKVHAPYFKIHFYKDQSKIFARYTDVVLSNFTKGEYKSEALAPSTELTNLFDTDKKYEILGETKITRPRFTINSYAGFDITLPYEMNLALVNDAKGPAKFATYALHSGKYTNNVMGEFSCELLEKQP